MKRLIKKANEDDMSFDEMKEEAIIAIQNMYGKLNRWDVRDTLKDMSYWGFYKGEMMVSVDEDVAGDILGQLEDYVDNIPNIESLKEVLDKIGRYAY